MPSMNKTEYYGLNQWAGSEYLKRRDLNGDNAIIDTALKEHEDALDEVKLQLAEKANPSVIRNVILPAAGWTGTSAPFTNTVNVAGVNANNNIYVAIGSGASTAQYTAAADAQLHCSGQGAGSITMRAFDTKPTVDIPISVLILG